MQYLAHTQGFSKYLFISLEREEIIELKGEENWGRGKEKEDELGSRRGGGWGSLSGIKSEGRSLLGETDQYLQERSGQPQYRHRSQSSHLPAAAWMRCSKPSPAERTLALQSQLVFSRLLAGPWWSRNTECFSSPSPKAKLGWRWEQEKMAVFSELSPARVPFHARPWGAVFLSFRYHENALHLSLPCPQIDPVMQV